MRDFARWSALTRCQCRRYAHHFSSHASPPLYRVEVSGRRGCREVARPGARDGTPASPFRALTSLGIAFTVGQKYPPHALSPGLRQAEDLPWSPVRGAVGPTAPCPDASSGAGPSPGSLTVGWRLSGGSPVAPTGASSTHPGEAREAHPCARAGGDQESVLAALHGEGEARCPFASQPMDRGRRRGRAEGPSANG